MAVPDHRARAAAASALESGSKMVRTGAHRRAVLVHHDTLALQQLHGHGAVSSTSSGSGSDLEDQLWLDESTNSKKEEGYCTGKGLPRAVALGDLPTSTRGAV